MSHGDFEEHEVIMLNDIERRLHHTLHNITNEYGEGCSLAIPAILLKITLQIYKHVMVDENDVEKIIMNSVKTLHTIPPLVRKETLH